ncbi:MAG: alkane 1-monooxygenase [Paracoccaceae bacterium]|nr:alkane 1-monooxygenase [Paracoccaceae bacterium]MDE3238458.1 alkane 1-monooxygenase [Paracoccaceae bacterium]
MRRPMVIFSVATLVPVVLLFIAAFAGGLWPWLALAYMTVFTFALDELLAITLPEAEPGVEFPAADRLSVILGVAHFLLLAVAIFTLAGGTGLGLASRIALFLAFGMFFGQVSNSNAHELIHRSSRGLFRLGMWIYISLLFGQHTSAHRHIHHRYVATEYDPNSAEIGESYWSFLPRAWVGSFTAGYQIEREFIRARGEGRNPYVLYLSAEAAFILGIFILFGMEGLIAYVLLAIYAQMQLLLSDYVQHYGLSRAVGTDGKAEPVTAAHSWNSGRWFSSALMLNAPRHSAHHAHPAWPYPELDLPSAEQAPRLPYSLPIMGLIALFPGRWFRMMDRRLEKWQTAAHRYG